MIVTQFGCECRGHDIKAISQLMACWEDYCMLLCKE